MDFGNQLGLYALLSLVPFILIYLIRPRPVEKMFPSLMFLFKDKRDARRKAFFQKFLANLLFLIQLLGIIVLSLAVASPFVLVPQYISFEDTVLVLDVSASMSAKYGMNTRFDSMISKADDYLGGRTSIVLAQNNPLVALEKGSRRAAKNVLSNLNPKATSSNIGDALIIAGSLLEGKKGRVVVLSDFIATEGSNVMVAKKSLEAQGIQVLFIDFGSKGKNVGIIDLKITKDFTKAYIKNFDEGEADVFVEVINGGEKIFEKSVTIAPNSVETVSFKNKGGVSEVKINTGDILALDNTAYVSSPINPKISVLVISNKPVSYIEQSLIASDRIEVVRAEPPVLPKIEHDVVIIDGVNPDLMLRGVMDEITEYIDHGGAVIVSAQDNIRDIKTMNRLLPVVIGNPANKTTVCFDIMNQFTKHIEGDRCGISQSKYYVTDAKPGSLTIATNSDGTPAISLWENGKGTVIYYGVFDDQSSFKTLTNYPIFWNLLVDFLVSSEDISDYNHKSGKIISINEQSVITPSSKLKTSKIILDEAGIYEYDGRKVAVNILSEAESDVSTEEAVEEGSTVISGNEESIEMTELDLDIILIWVALAILAIELWYIKQRGDM